MKSPAQVAKEGFWVSSKEHRGVATNCMRLATGVRSLVASDELTPKERIMLAKASALLEQMAAGRKKAAALKDMKAKKSAGQAPSQTPVRKPAEALQLDLLAGMKPWGKS